jgi:hypothetical protein
VAQSKLLGNEDANPAFDGIRLYVKAAVLGIDSARSQWALKNNTTIQTRVGRSRSFPNAAFAPAPLDFQIVWNSTATDSAGRWLFPGDTLLNTSLQKRVITPFRIINTLDTTKVQVIVSGNIADPYWRPGKELAFLTPARFNPPRNAVMLSVFFDTAAAGQTVLPAHGNIYEVKTSKPFARGDQFLFTTKAAKYEPGRKDALLNKIYVVPNPYVAYSYTESPGTTSSRRGVNDLQFRNLPPKCTIRIYTITGELVDTIEKDDNTSFARWNVLSFEAHRLAYGVYIYHVEVPGVGEKIGRLALIK